MTLFENKNNDGLFDKLRKRHLEYVKGIILTCGREVAIRTCYDFGNRSVAFDEDQNPYHSIQILVFFTDKKISFVETDLYKVLTGDKK